MSPPAAPVRFPWQHTGSNTNLTKHPLIERPPYHAKKVSKTLQPATQRPTTIALLNPTILQRAVGRIFARGYASSSKRTRFYGSMKSHIEILHQPTVDTSLCLVLHYENARYLFNCGEGTQRSLVENKVRLSNKVKDIFISRVDWDSLGGLPGMLMTVADAGSKNVTVHGGPNTTHVLTGMRNFMMRKDLSLTVDEYSRDNVKSTFQDQNINLEAICVLPDQFNKVSPVAGLKRHRDGTPTSDHQQRTDILKSMFGYDAEHPLAEEVPSTDPLEQAAAKGAANGILSIVSNKEEAIPARKAATLPETKPFPAAYSYICRGPARPGKFLVEKAKALGLKPGPAFGELQRGSSVTLENGTVIQPHQCLGPGRDGALFLIIDCPSAEYVSNLTSSTAFTSLDPDEPVCLIHNVGKHVIRDSRYQEWMQKFKSAQHLVASSEHCANSIIFRSAAHNLTTLSKLDAEMFNTPVYCNQPEAQLDLPKNLNVVAVETGMIFHLEPDRRLAPPPASAFSTDGPPSKSATEYLAMVDRIKSDTFMSEGSPTASTYDDVRITTLGTGSSSPSKYRNVSSTLVEIPRTGALLLDTGEGTMGQLCRRFGSETDDKLRSIKMIFISHMHADHHLGLFRVLQQWSKANAANDTELFILGPHFLERWMTEYAQAEDIGLSRMAFIDNRALYYARQHVPAELIPALDSLELKELKTTDVIHCPWAFALKIKHKSGFSLAYSGDTRPSNKFIAMGQNVSVLIHEATLEDDMAEEAVKKRHCTTAEAIQVGLAMRAKHLLLTHFSQRYPKVPILTSIPTDSTCEDIGVSFDLMSVRYSELHKLPKYVEAFKLLYQEEEVSDDEKENLTVVKAKAKATNGKAKTKTPKQKDLQQDL